VDRPELERRRAESRARTRRNRLVALFSLATVAAAAVAVVIVSGSDSGSGNNAQAGPDAYRTVPEKTDGQPATEPAEPEPKGPPPQQIKPAVPGKGKVITEGPSSAGRKVALTIDDGTCAKCVDRILDVLEQTGGKATVFPNGVYASSWEPQADRIRKLVADRQLTLGNHTYSHQVSTQIGPEAFGADLQRNEDWIQETFKLTGRPWFRPPYGDRDASIDSAAGQRGYRKVIMWSGTVADSDPRSEAYILNAIDYWAKPGAIILMHANYPATGKALPKIFRMLEKRRLEPVTLAELLGSS
jgi:peptidoglycan/xylan/chitin deacetylase (PgdA/CDA1 family)